MYLQWHLGKWKTILQLQLLCDNDSFSPRKFRPKLISSNRPQDSVRQKQTQILAIKDQLRTKVDALRKELESKRRSSAVPDHELHLSKFESVNI
jgi:hypothetical protein